MEYKVGDIFALKNKSVWEIVGVKDDSLKGYPIVCKFTGGTMDDEYFLENGNTVFSKNLELCTEEDWVEDKSERLKYTFDKFITESEYPEYFI